MTLDTGALVAFERRDRRVNVLIQRASDAERRIVIPAAALAQAWRGGGPRQARLVMLLSGRNVVVEELTRRRAAIAGDLCARSGTSDVVDASVVVAAWANGHIVVTSDPRDLRHLDHRLDIIAV